MTDLQPVRKEVVVDGAPDEAFELFTAGVGKWWPTATHSLFGEASRAQIEPRVGGRFYEIGPDGDEAVWGSVVAWDPPQRFATTWHVGREPSDAQTVEVSFADAGDGRTRVVLVHSGWTAADADMRSNYDTGWDAVLAKFTAG
ncbi:MAG TPA: SRPBCC family protein [Acidimicrobiales bacterium]